MPELTEKEQQLFRYSTAVATDKEKYIVLDLTNPNAMKEYFEKEEKKMQNKIRLRVKKLRLESNKNQEEKDKRKFNNDVVKQLADYYNIKVSDIVD